MIGQFVTPWLMLCGFIDTVVRIRNVSRREFGLRRATTYEYGRCVRFSPITTVFLFRPAPLLLYRRDKSITKHCVLRVFFYYYYFLKKRF